ncbi:MAG: menaquinone biosynthesis protein [Acidobacteriota bacterium]|nr:menaquinone biosynthesis protein [Acidobacteriota bacterium]MDH3783928.1 menaquinone biosynthesis protein [Acidobacteriota bacterium]
MRPRVGAVSYLNARPLVYGLEEDAVRGALRLEYEVPSRLAERMVSGELDIALIPIIGLTELRDLELISGLGIVTRGPSRSVLIVSRKPLDRIGSLALDPESRTSNVLAQVLLAERFGVQPRAEVGPVDLKDSLDRFDAVVRIGDKALFESYPSSCNVLDLGTEWTDWTGLPFVFAAWFSRPGALNRETYRRLHDSRRKGVAAIESISNDYEFDGIRNPELAGEYLRKNIHFRLGSAEVEAMKRFFGLAADLGLIDEAPPIRLALQQSTGCHETAARLAEGR